MLGTVARVTMRMGRALLILAAMIPVAAMIPETSVASVVLVDDSVAFAA